MSGDEREPQRFPNWWRVDWAYSVTQPGIDREVLVWLANSADADEGKAWPGVDKIAGKIWPGHTNPKTKQEEIRRCLRRLEAAGLVVTTRDHVLPSGGRSNTYLVKMPVQPALQNVPGLDPGTSSGDIEETTEQVPGFEHGRSPGLSQNVPGSGPVGPRVAHAQIRRNQSPEPVSRTSHPQPPGGGGIEIDQEETRPRTGAVPRFRRGLGVIEEQTEQARLLDFDTDEPRTSRSGSPGRKQQTHWPWTYAKHSAACSRCGRVDLHLRSPRSVDGAFVFVCKDTCDDDPGPVVLQAWTDYVIGNGPRPPTRAEEWQRAAEQAEQQRRANLTDEQRQAEDEAERQAEEEERDRLDAMRERIRSMTRSRVTEESA